MDGHSFVFFHVDGDVPWSRARAGTNHRKWHELVVDRVVRHVRAKKSEAETLAARQRILLLGPHYSIEAWLYQNTVESTRACRDQHRAAHVRTLEAHLADRAGLDEVMQPKAHFCLQDRHNLALAEKRFPIEDVEAAGASFAASLDGLRACADLVSALRDAAS